MPLSHLLRTYLFLIPLFVLLLSEITKACVGRLRTGNWHEHIFRQGGMPSSHSAFVTSLLILIWRKLGATSIEFAIAMVFASIVWYDAMNSRRTLGEQSKILNRLQQWQHLAENVGHSTLEVLAGIGFGIIITSVGIWMSGQNW